MTEALKPYPVAAGVSTNCGTKTNMANVPKLTSAAAALVAQTVRRRISGKSTSGARLRRSTTTQIAASTAAAASSPATRPEPQPQAGAWLIASSRATSHAASPAAPSQSTCPGVRMGDSGTRGSAASITTIVPANGIQNSQW